MDQGWALLVRAIQQIQDLMVATILTVTLFFGFVLASTLINLL
tara:strand:- start:1457 stop:1585 length:129 start_codon:yes stop_codon:yes gene_type:complete